MGALCGQRVPWDIHSERTKSRRSRSCHAIWLSVSGICRFFGNFQPVLWPMSRNILLRCDVNRELQTSDMLLRCDVKCEPTVGWREMIGCILWKKYKERRTAAAAARPPQFPPVTASIHALDSQSAIASTPKKKDSLSKAINPKMTAKIGFSRRREQSWA